jgi:hypothetical protein
MLVKAGTGLVAGVVAGLLGLAFMPQGAPVAVQPRQAVEKPQLVFAKEAGPPNVQTASAVAVAPEAAVPAAPAAGPIPAPAKIVEVAKPAAPGQQAAVAKPALTAEPARAPPIAVARLDPPAPAAKPPSPTALPVSQAPARQAPAAAPANEAAARWSVPGLIALAKGDLSTARVFLIRAAEAGDARAWVALADTYDPAILAKLGVVGAPGDPQRARDYLGRAAAAGILVPKDRMAALDQTPGSVR